MMYSASEIKQMLRNRGQRSKLSWNQLPEKYKLMRARNAVIGRKGAKAPQSYRDKLIQQMQANPGQRALLPDKYLTPEQRKMRSTNTYLNTELFPGSGMRGKDLETQVRRNLQLQYGEQDQADANALAQAQANRVRNSQWWDQYQQAVQNAQTAFNQYAQAQQAPQISTSAPVVNGQVASPTAPASSGVQAALGSIAAGRVNSNQMASAAALASGVNTAGQRVGEQRALLDQFVNQAIGQQKQTARRKQMSAEDLRTKLISEAQQRFLERSALISKDEQAKLDRAFKYAQLSSQERQNAEDNATSRANNADDNATSTANNQRNNNNRNNGKPKYASPAKQAEYLAAWTRIKTLAQAFKRAHGNKYGSDWYAERVMADPKAPTAPESLFRAGAELVRDGYVHSKTIRALHKQGIKFNQLGARRINPARGRGSS